METKFTRFAISWSKLICLFLLTLSTSATINAQECACKGTIQVSVDELCEAEIFADMLLANGSTCGGSSTAMVTLMATPNGNPLFSGLGSVLLENGTAWIGKTLYGKVTSTSGNSCWSTINIEDKLPPRIECPANLTLTCYQMASFMPVVTENCTPYTMEILNETIRVNDCRPATGLPDEVLKVITRTYSATDGSGNVSTPCTMTITVLGLPSLDDPYITMPANRWLADQTELQCDADYAKIPVGQSFAGHPSPVNIGTKLGTGVPKITVWDPFTSGAGQVRPSVLNNAVSLTGGSTGVSTLPSIVGSQLCFTADRSGSVRFNWSASMVNNAGQTVGGDFNNDWPAYSLNGANTYLATTGNSASGGPVTVNVTSGDVFCFKVYTMNTGYYTILNITNLVTPTPLYLDLYPNPDLYCNVLVSFTDVKLPEIGCVTKILRTWQVLEWSCRGAQRIRNHLQMIEIVDKVGPTITCPAPVTVSTSQHSCEGTVAFPAIVTADNCSSTVTVDITYPGGFIKGSNGGFGRLPVGCHSVSYTAYDGCYNSNTCFYSVTVEDNTPPVAVCDEFTTVGLTSDGRAWVPATVFDDGSYDECALGKMLVRRMDPAACLPCKTPEFPGFTFLGELGPDGSKHYYYLSNHKAAPHVALKTAKSMGGYAVSIGTSAENTFVYDRVKALNYGEDYLIGLRDAKSKGDWRWESGENSTYRNWAPGHPAVPSVGYPTQFTNVQNSNGRWYDFGVELCENEEYRYVVEIDNPCGFSAFTQFCCDDIGTNQMVVFRVIDKAGNWNECMVNAVVQDKLPPSITCPPHRNVTCDDIFDISHLRHSFGWPTAFDNCENPTITTDSIINLNQCRIGTITRNFTVRDRGGRTSTCQQIIHVDHGDLFTMNQNRWPADREVNGCANPNDAAFHPDNVNMGKPNLTNDDFCSLVGVDYRDQVFYFNNSTGEACFKILRHWTVIDWCQEYIDSFGGTNYRTWTHTQVIKVSDSVKPVITSSCARKEVCTFDPSCLNGYIELTATATDNCTDVLKWYAYVDINNNGTFDSGSFGVGLNYPRSGNGNTANMSGEYPIGSHRIQWVFEDKCGNLTKCDQLFDIINCKAPTPYCLNGLATDLMPVDTNNDGTIDGGMVEIWASDFDRGSAHPCGYNVILAFEPVTRNANGTLFIKDSIIFDCSTLGRQEVNLYAAIITPNGDIIQAFCSTFIDIQDNMNACVNGRRVAVDGIIKTEAELGVSNVEVKLVGSEMITMTNDGMYEFNNLLEGASYTVSPTKNDDAMNGVSTLDLVLIQRHILQIASLNSPYKLIAADVNNDKKLNTGDLVELRKVILGIQTNFSNNTSWRFVDKDYTFLDPANAYAENFKEVYNITNINQDMLVNFVGVKTGDVSGDVKANVNQNSVENRTNHAVQLQVNDARFTTGQQIELPISMAEYAAIAGMQFTLNFNAQNLEFAGVKSGVLNITDANFGFHKLSEGMISASWNSMEDTNLEAQDVIMTLVFKAIGNGSVSESFEISSDITKAESYTSNGIIGGVNWNVKQSTDEVAFNLFQNSPNPFKAMTKISFELPKDMDATLTFHDVTGKLVYTISNNFTKGMNTIQVNKIDLVASGLMYYTLEAGEFKATRKMIVIE